MAYNNESNPPMPNIYSDKVLHNSYNRGAEIYIPVEGRPQVDPSVESLYKETTSGDLVAMRETERLNNLISEVFHESPYKDIDSEVGEDYKSLYVYLQKNDKLTKVFNDLKALVMDKVSKEYSEYDVIVGLFEFLDVDYKYMWKHVLSPAEKSIVYAETVRYSKVHKDNNLTELF